MHVSMIPRVINKRTHCVASELLSHFQPHLHDYNNTGTNFPEDVRVRDVAPTIEVVRMIYTCFLGGSGPMQTSEENFIV